MKIDIANIDTERFHINERVIPGLGEFFLVVPHKAMWSWHPHEVHLRSILCRKDGTVVSSGFPKFFNMGERPESDRVVSNALSNSIITEKVDGSLIIASVIDGAVHFRTRGCEVVAEIINNEFHKLVNDKYPSLLDAKNDIYAEGCSTLFEYVSTSNRIVVKYEEPKLVLLGRSDHSTDRLIIRLADESMSGHGLPEPVSRLATMDDIQQLAETVRAYDDREGIVIWTKLENEDILTKLKSAWYIRLHALRSEASPRYIREFCFKYNACTITSLKEALFSEGLDWETCEYIEPIFNEFKEQYDNACDLISAVDFEIKNEALRSLSTRKEIALKAKDIATKYDGTFSYIMASAMGDYERANVIADSLKFGIPVAALKTLRVDNGDKEKESKKRNDDQPVL